MTTASALCNILCNVIDSLVVYVTPTTTFNCQNQH